MPKQWRSGSRRCTVCKMRFTPSGPVTGLYCSLPCWYSVMGRFSRIHKDRPCKCCKKLFHPGASAKYCSTSCANVGKRKPRYHLNCKRCGKKLRSLYRRPKFCSRQCAYRHWVESGSAPGSKPDGSRQRGPGGYVVVKVSGKWKLEHRHVMERELGRSLTKKERVHHINGRRRDNRPSNLELWTRAHPSGVRAADAPHCQTCTCVRTRGRKVA